MTPASSLKPPPEDLVRNSRFADPGTATTSMLASHWAVSASIAREIISQAGIPNVSTSSRRKYRWDDVWRFEGAGVVPRCDWGVFKAPMLLPSHLALKDPESRSERTWRRHVKSGALPSVHLIRGIRRVRENTFEALHAYL